MYTLLFSLFPILCLTGILFPASPASSASPTSPAPFAPPALIAQPNRGQLQEEAQQLLQQAYQQVEQGRLPSAIALFQQALTIAKQIQARDIEASALLAIGDYSNTLGQRQSALEALNQALLIFQEIDETEGEGITLHNLGWVYQGMDQPQQALNYYQQALPLLQAVGNRLGEAATLNNMGLLEERLGRPQQTLVYYQQVLQITREEGYRLEEASTLNNLGVVYRDLGQPQPALSVFNQALQIFREMGDRSQEANALNSIGEVYRLMGRLAEALQFHTPALLIRQEVGDRDGISTSLNNLGLVYRALGQPQQALDYYQQSLSIARELGNAAGAATTLNNLGTLYSALEQPQQALDYLNQALQIRRQIGDRGGVANSLNNLGWVYISMGQPQQALDYYQQALPILREVGDRLREASTLNNIGRVYQDLGQLPRALDYFNQSLPIFQAVEDADGEATVLKNLGEAQWLSGNFSAAQRNLLASIQILETLRTGLNNANQVSLFETQLASYDRLQQVLIDQNQPEQALEIAERGRARAFVELLAQRLVTRSSAIPQIDPPSIADLRRTAQTHNATLVEYSIVSQQDLYIWVVSPMGQVTFHQADLSALDIPLKDLVSDTRQQIGVRNRGESQAIAFAPGDWVRLNTDAPDYEPWRVIAVDAERRLLSLTQSSLPEGVSIERPATDVIAKVDSRRAHQPRLQQLHQLLIDPIAQYLPTDPNAHVIFIPHRELFLVPFAALQDTDGTYLIEKHTILTAPAIQVLDLTRQQRQQLGRRESGAGSREFLIVGNPTMPEVVLEPGQSPQPLATLPNAELEARAIAQVWGAQALIGDQATEFEVVAKMPQSRMIHLATHGLLDETRGLGSALALAPSADRDGLLTAEEILALNLSAELVVLSACNTGRGRITGDGVIGLSRSFISVGVPSLVVSLWMVRDAPTADLMTEFYQNLQNTADKAQALRQAMLTMLENYPDPKNWAAFTLIGEAE